MDDLKQMKALKKKKNQKTHDSYARKMKSVSPFTPISIYIIKIKLHLKDGCFFRCKSR